LQIVPYQAFQTADAWLNLAVGNDGQFQRFCQAAGRPDLAADPRFATNTLRVQHRDILVPLVAELFRTKPAAEWQRLLTEHEVPFAPVWDYAQLFAQDQVAHRAMKVHIRTPEGKEVDLLGSPFHINGQAITAPACPPLPGQDSAEILREVLGMEETEIARLRQQGVTG
jgi:crotonobetainyl-CoA:carnitine CoA-transferase CaiB-like acyl-CoA transferase